MPHLRVISTSADEPHNGVKCIWSNSTTAPIPENLKSILWGRCLWFLPENTFGGTHPNFNEISYGVGAVIIYKAGGFAYSSLTATFDFANLTATAIYTTFPPGNGSEGGFG